MSSWKGRSILHGLPGSKVGKKTMKKDDVYQRGVRGSLICWYIVLKNDCPAIYTKTTAGNLVEKLTSEMVQ